VYLDDKGYLPSDGVYSGTIDPPTPGLPLQFYVSFIPPGGGNPTTFIDSNLEPAALVVSPDGATWTFALLAYTPNGNAPLDSSAFAASGTYSLHIVGTTDTVQTASWNYPK